MSRQPVGTIRKVVDWILGLTLIAIGMVGGLVPILQGWVFIVAGLAVLSSHSRWARAAIERLKGVGRRLGKAVRRQQR